MFLNTWSLLNIVHPITLVSILIPLVTLVLGIFSFVSWFKARKKGRDLTVYLVIWVVCAMVIILILSLMWGAFIFSNDFARNLSLLGGVVLVPVGIYSLVKWIGTEDKKRVPLIYKVLGISSLVLLLIVIFAVLFIVLLLVFFVASGGPYGL